jgi:hypothetical protein
LESSWTKEPYNTARVTKINYGYPYMKEIDITFHNNCIILEL